MSWLGIIMAMVIHEAGGAVQVAITHTSREIYLFHPSCSGQNICRLSILHPLSKWVGWLEDEGERERENTRVTVRKDEGN